MSAIFSRSRSKTRDSDVISNKADVGTNYKGKRKLPSRAKTVQSLNTSDRVERRTVAALGSSSSWEYLKLLKTEEPCVDAEALLEQATELLRRRTESAYYHESADAMIHDLCSVTRRLQDISLSDNANEKVWCARRDRVLSDLYGELGDYHKAGRTMDSICPDFDNAAETLTGALAQCHVDTILHFLAFCAWTGRDSEKPKLYGQLLPWTRIGSQQTECFKLSILARLAHISHDEGAYEEAVQYLWMAQHASTDSWFHADYLARRAAVLSHGNDWSLASDLFVKSLLVTTLSHGLWHRNTLDTLFCWGHSLRLRGQATAVGLLEICAQGFSYTFGKSHPLTRRAIVELKECDLAEISLRTLCRLTHEKYSRERSLSLAFETYHVADILDTLQPICGLDYVMIAQFVEAVLKAAPELLSFRAQRLLAHCLFEAGRPTQALNVIHRLCNHQPDLTKDTLSHDVRMLILASDLARYSTVHGTSGGDEATMFKKAFFVALHRISDEQGHQVRALHRRLMSQGLTHFTREDLLQEPALLCELNEGPIGTGSYSIVDRVKVGQKVYARKSYHLPRRRQEHLRDDIRKELTIIQALEHPHNIRVILTYEETNRYCIIMHPVADNDLENYLHSKTCNTVEDRHQMWKWIGCLSSTLAFIHSQSVRHKDIKPRNILIKGEKIYFTDFGSSHMFGDDGVSTTDGPAFGHTRAYCAPEVLENSSRNRSSDVFSLGCVFAEMLVWTQYMSVPELWAGIRPSGQLSDPQYSASIPHMKTWFQESTDELRKFYSLILKRMVRTKAEARWPAVDISRAITTYFTDVPQSQCEKCLVDAWVPSVNLRRFFDEPPWWGPAYRRSKYTW